MKYFSAGQSKVNKNTLEALGQEIKTSNGGIMKMLSKNLIKVFKGNFEDYVAFPIPCTGTGAMEVAISSFVDKNTEVLVISNGFFGERMYQISSIYSEKTRILSSDFGEKLNLEKIEKEIKNYKPKIVLAVHGETSCGIKNPIKEIAKICKENNAIFIVDAASTLAVSELETAEWGIDVVYSVSQKGLGMTPGISPIIVKKKLIEKLKNSKKNTYYLSLYDLYNNWYNYEYHHSLCTSMCYGLNENLIKILDYGLENRWNVIKNNAHYLWKEARKLGIDSNIELNDRLESVSIIKLGNNAENVREILYNEFEVLVSSTFNDKDSLRIGIYNGLDNSEMKYFVDSLKKAIKKS